VPHSRILFLLTVSSNYFRNDTPREKIRQMLGHSNVIVTEHFLVVLYPDVTFGVNDPILQQQ
jgi:hypothetical protein